MLQTAIVAITLQRNSGLLALICDDLTVRLIDVETRRVVREFSGYGGRILDLVRASDLSKSCLSILMGCPRHFHPTHVGSSPRRWTSPSELLTSPRVGSSMLSVLPA